MFDLGGYNKACFRVCKRSRGVYEEIFDGLSHVFFLQVGLLLHALFPEVKVACMCTFFSLVVQNSNNWGPHDSAQIREQLHALM